MSAAAAVAGLPKPYYDEDGVTVYQGDCRELLPAIGSFDAIITDPVWPKASKLLKGSADPYRLWAEFCALLGPGQASRMVVQLGCLSDPRFLAPIPEWLTFFRVCWLSYVVPSFRGRAVNGADVAYVFGNPPRTFPNGRTLAPGCQMARPNRADFNRSLGANRSQKTYYENQERMDHPAARRLSHVLFLALWGSSHKCMHGLGAVGEGR